MYKTSAQDYGSKRPTYHSMPIEFHGKSQKFSNVSELEPCYNTASSILTRCVKNLYCLCIQISGSSVKG